MRFTTAPAKTLEPTDARPGPQPLSLADLKHVAGGAPRGGWTSSVQERTNSGAPRGGWTSAVEDAPRGGWYDE